MYVFVRIYMHMDMNMYMYIYIHTHAHFRPHVRASGSSEKPWARHPRPERVGREDQQVVSGTPPPVGHRDPASSRVGPMFALIVVVGRQIDRHVGGPD